MNASAGPGMPSDVALVANARMYAVEPNTANAWRTLLDWVAATASVPLRYVEHDAPLPALWLRDDLGCAFMCGHPWATWNQDRRPVPLAVPIPANPESAGRARYRSAIVVREESSFASLDALRGRRFAYTTPHSQSGYQSVRRLLADRVERATGRYFEATVGPLITPRRVVQAVLDDEADGGPLDSYWLDLLRRHEPATAARLRVVAVTPWTPLPMMVASATLPASVHDALSHALVAAGAAPELEGIRGTLGLGAIARPDPASYSVLAARAREADALGYPTLQ